MTIKLKIRSVSIILICISFLYGCKPEPVEIVFEDQEDFTIFDYMEQNAEEFSSFIQIVEKGSLKNALSSYNPYGDGFTLFLPDNRAIDNFIENDFRFSSLNNLLEDLEFCYIFSRYHVVNMSVQSNEFPFGAFSEQTLSDDFLTVSFIIESDSSYYKINNNATVVKSDIEVSNGFIHQIQTALNPVTYTTFQWLGQQPEFSIFLEAVKLTGLGSLIDFNLKESENKEAVTVLLEPDSVFNKRNIYSVDDLIELISPDDNNYTDEKNPLNLFVSYHFLKGSFFIDDFVDINTLYSTYSDVPLNIDGNGLDIKINPRKEIFDTIILNADTTYIDFIKFEYDESNMLSQSGAIHLIDEIMRRARPSPTVRTFQFMEEPSLNPYRQEGGNFLLEDEGQFSRISWSGADLYFIKLLDQESSAWNDDYLEINGDFVISYTIPEIIQGSYEVILRADSYSEANAVIEVFIDGRRVGGLIDLSTGGSASSPFQSIELGDMDFARYSEHDVEIRPLIPGRFLWDFIRFEPVNR